jgi:hypothetical protein
MPFSTSAFTPIKSFEKSAVKAVVKFEVVIVFLLVFECKGRV